MYEKYNPSLEFDGNLEIRLKDIGVTISDSIVILEVYHSHGRRGKWWYSIGTFFRLAEDS